jgi:hypothetical protein
LDFAVSTLSFLSRDHIQPVRCAVGWSSSSQGIRPLGPLSLDFSRQGEHITGICARGSRSLGPHCSSLDSGGILNCRHPMFRGSAGYQVCVFSERCT